MGCCCSNDSESDTIEKPSKSVTKEDETYENPLMIGKERPMTYGATAETTCVEQRRSSPIVAVEAASPAQSDNTETVENEEKTEPKRKKSKNKFKKLLKKNFKTDKKGQKDDKAEKQSKHSKLTYQDITTLRENEKQKRAENRVKDLEAKVTSKVVLEALEKVHERGEKLGKLQDTTDELNVKALSFAENARRVAELEEQKYLAKKRKKEKKT
ncbi:uncharacterized protein [Antedon mediterranea]|uniref:uncharacterized protein n=1 Tax=Antedon mediterranea TaxID=105859 RepID=UPI003AF747E6